MGLEALGQFLPDNKKPSQQHSAPQPKKEEKQNEFRPKPNIGWLFYKDYFKDLDYAKLDDAKNEEIINKKVANITNQSFTMQKSKNLGNAKFELTTIYPGLLLGSGNVHELPDVKGQAILGFHFDYSSGLPEIAGSSIKGVLRSAFAHEEYIKDIAKNQSLDVKKLEIEIFGQDGKSNEVVAGKDIFFDAIIIKGNKNNKILSDDYITPHKEAIKNPIPLRFIKVLPEVIFEFSFDLKVGTLSIEEKKELFREIILDFGLGAKTNVGYGKFTEAK